jgi:archaellum component FlaG (FlaF/FlaG flagellin family)
LVKSQTNTEIAVNNLHSGYYIVQVVLDNGISTHKINKQ